MPTILSFIVRKSFSIFRHRISSSLLIVIFLTSTFVPKLCNAVVPAPLNPTEIQGKIKNISHEIKEDSTSRQDIDEAREIAEDFQQKATECIDASTAQITTIDKEILTLGPIADNEPLNTAQERRKLIKEKKAQQVRLSGCRLITTLLTRLKNDLSDRERIQKKTAFFLKTETFYNRIRMFLPAFGEFKSQLITFSLNRFGLASTPFSDILILLLLAAAGGIGGLIFFRFSHNRTEIFSRKQPRKPAPSLRGRTAMAIAFATLASGCYFIYAYSNTPSQAYGPWLLLSVGIFFASLMLFHFYTFFIPNVFLTASGAPPVRRVRFLIFLCAVLFFTTHLNIEGFMALKTPLSLAQSGIICAVCFAGCWLLWSLNLPKGLIRFKKIIRAIIVSVSILIVVVELSGYRNFSIFLLVGFLGTFLLAALLKGILAAIDEIIGGLFSGRYLWQQKARHIIGISTDEKLMGVLWLGFIFKLLSWFTAFFLLLQVWGLSPDQRHQIVSYLVEGLHVGSVVIAPARIVLGILVFACCWTLISWIKMLLEKSWLQHTHISRSAQETLVTATGYAGFALALVFGFSIAGVSFSNLAIIAGALSVGIGFGLQNIVNNFVSGLIILFERPVKRGDWISVGNTEGYVQKISVRSTLIQTFDRSDVIVPNSELISNQVTNMMLNDRYGRVIIPIGVAYGSDTDLVKTILLDIARANTKVVSDGTAPQPQVLFLEFGDSSLNFELRCYLANIDDRLVVKSEINFEIDRAFRKHNITIPFPQRDLYIKESPPMDSSTKGT